MSEGEAAAELAKGGFDTLLTCTAPVFWVFFLLTGISLFVLRERDRQVERPFKPVEIDEESALVGFLRRLFERQFRWRITHIAPSLGTLYRHSNRLRRNKRV